MNDSSVKLSITKWVLLIILPFVALTAVTLLQFLIHFIIASNGTATSSTTTLTSMVVNFISVIIGIFSVISILLLPVWIILLVKTINFNHATDNSRLSKTAAVLFAIFMSFWTWVYTYERDKTKFWINLVLSIVTVGIWGIVAWIWAIIDTANKPDDYYNFYPEYN